MTEPHSDTYHYLLTHYGPLLTLNHLAEVMHSTPDALRMAITRQRQPIMEALAQSRRQVGRRIFFEARRVAEIIDQDVNTATKGNTYTSSSTTARKVNRSCRRNRGHWG